MSNFLIFDIDSLLLNFPEYRYFIDLLKTTNMEVGIINMKKNQKDIQQPHDVDEIYYIISGVGSLEINGNKNDISTGKIIYIPRKLPHSFNALSDELIVLYILA
ncbi:MAG: cupin domain-containing protein [Nitrososphaeraceae archaeon]